MSKTQTRKWRKLCLRAAAEKDAEQRMVLVTELSRLLHKDVYNFGSIRVDVGRATVTRNGQPIYLTNLEFKLLCYFIERAGCTLSRDELLRSVWSYDRGTFTRTVDIHVHGLREKLEQDAKRPQLIVTVPGVGYKFLGFQTQARQPGRNSRAS